MNARTTAHDSTGNAVDAPAASAPASARPHVLFVTRKWPPAMGGMETYSVKVADQLSRFARVETLALPGQADGSAPTAPTLLAFGIRAAASIIFRTSTADVTHVADMSSWPLALLARLRSPRRKVALSAHGTDVSYADRPGMKARVYRHYMRLGALCLSGCKVIANSQATADKLTALGFRTLDIVPLATDMTRAESTAHAPRRILFAGRLVERKGCRWFIENVLPTLPEDVTLDVAGTVWDPREEAALAAPRVTFLGALSPEKLTRAYANAACVIVPNVPVETDNFEGFGLVAAEAAAAGAVVLASAHSGLNDAVIDGETGLKLPPGDAAAWSAAVQDVLGWSDAKRTAFVEKASATAQAHYAWDRVGEGTFAAYGVAS